MTSYPKIAHNLFMYEIRDTSDPIIAPRIENKTNEISKFLEKNNIICNDQYAITYISDISELGYMMLPKIKNNIPIDLNIDTCLYSFELSINGYTSQGIYPYSEDKNNNTSKSAGLISIKQIGVDNIIYIFDKTNFIGVKVDDITVNNM
jgi:hypothetical protein